MSKKDKELAKTDENKDLQLKSEVDGAIPGLENVDQGDIIIPRLDLMQKTSKAVEREDDPAKPGDYVNTITGIITAPPFEVVPIFFNKAAILFGENAGDEIICKAPDGKYGNFHGLCEKCDYNYKLWVENEPPKCTAIFQFFCVFADEEPEAATPFIVSMKATGAKTAKKWLSAAKFAGPKVPLFGVKYSLGSLKKENKAGTFYVPTIAAAGRIDPVPYFVLYEMIFDAFNAGAIKADLDDVFKDDDENDIPI